MLNSLTHVLTKHTKPSALFEVYRSMNKLDIYFPELKAIIGIHQNSEKFIQAKELAHKLRMAMVDKDIALKQIRGSIGHQK